MANSTLYDEAAFVTRYGDLSKALRNFEAVRCTTFACAALAILGSLYLLPREFRLIWRQRFTLTRLLLLLNQTLILVKLCTHIRIFTLNRDTDENPCPWWFVFRSWSSNVMLLLITMVILFRLVALFNRKVPIITVSAITIVAQASLSTAFMAMHAKEMTKLLTKTPIPGPSFKGCFPVLSQEESSAVWFSAMTVQCLGMIIAICLTIQTWRASDNHSFLALIQRNGIFHFMAITFSTIFAKIFFTFTPKSLVLAATPIPMVTYSFFGTLLLLNLLEQQNSPLDLQARLSTFLYRSEIDSAGLNAKGGKDFELGLPRAPGLSKKAHRTPEGEVTFSASPCVTVMSRQYVASEGAEKQSPAETSLSMVAPSEGIPTCTDQVCIEEGPRLRSALTTLNTRASDLSLGRHHSSDDLSDTRRIETLQQQQIDEWEALDEALSEEYDEYGKRRRPRRTHERKWKSDDVVIMTTPTLPSAVASTQRFSELNFCSPQYTLLSPTPPGTFSSNAATPRSSLPIPPPRAKKVPGRSQLSVPDCPHPSQEPNPTLALAPVPMPQEAADISSGFIASGPMSPPVPDGPLQLLHRSSSMRRSSPSSSVRARRLPEMSRVPNPTGSPPRGDSDGVTISSASTGWAFDNNNTRDAPDFGN